MLALAGAESAELPGKIARRFAADVRGNGDPGTSIEAVAGAAHVRHLPPGVEILGRDGPGEEHSPAEAEKAIISRSS